LLAAEATILGVQVVGAAAADRQVRVPEEAMTLMKVWIFPWWVVQTQTVTLYTKGNAHLTASMDLASRRAVVVQTSRARLQLWKARQLAFHQNLVSSVHAASLPSLVSACQAQCAR